MQTAAAFAQVQVALNWLFDNYPRIAEWLASAGRVTGLWTAFTQLDASVGQDKSDRIVIADSPDDTVRLEDLSVAQYNGRVMINEASTAIARGDKVLLTGESGTGKSTLIRAIAGLWPWGSGRVLLPQAARVAFLPQRAYIPNGTLRQVLHYPITAREPPTEELAAALERCGLHHLVPRLDEEDRWDRLLSGGEQQRIGFVRLLVQRPDVVIMDEATAALDVESQASMMELFRHELADTTVISVGHRPELEQYHTRKLSLRRFAVEDTGERGEVPGGASWAGCCGGRCGRARRPTRRIRPFRSRVQSSSGLRRRRLTAPRWVLASTRRRRAAPVGLVSRRITGRTAACRSKATTRSRASWRLRSCDRKRWALITSTPSPVTRRPPSASAR